MIALMRDTNTEPREGSVSEYVALCAAMQAV